jgi:hypothetical protein
MGAIRLLRDTPRGIVGMTSTRSAWFDQNIGPGLRIINGSGW